MSYDPEDLRSGIVELFADAVEMSCYKVEFHELPARVGQTEEALTWRRVHRLPRSAKERANDHERKKRARAADRERRDAERRATPKTSLAPLSTIGMVPWPHYRCDRCGSTTPTHRCLDGRRTVSVSVSRPSYHCERCFSRAPEHRCPR